MGMYTFTGPDGRAYDVNGPQGSTKEQAFSMLQGHLTQQPAETLKTAARPPVPAATTAGTTTTPPPAASGGTPPPATPPPATTPPPSSTPNINAGAPGNPLDLLLAGRSPFGSAGGLLAAPNTSPPTGEGGYPLNPNDGYIYSGDARYQQVQAALDALSQKAGGTQYAQLRDTNIGGQGEAIDPSKVVYDPVAGLVTPVTNIMKISTGADDAWTAAIMAMIAGPAIAAAFAGAGGAGAAVEGAGAGAGGAGGAGGLLDGLDLSPIAPTTAGGITPLEAGPFDPTIAGAGAGAGGGGGAGGGLDIANYPGGPGSVPPPDIPPADITMQPPPDIPGTDLMPTLPGGGGGGSDLFTAQNAFRAAGAIAPFVAGHGGSSTPPGVVNPTQANQPILDQARQILQANGQPTPDQKGGIDAIVDRQIREGTAAIKQRAINSGMGADSMVTQQQINTLTENANGLRAQLYMQQANQNINTALKEWEMANSQDLAVQKLIAEYQLQQDKDSQVLAANISKAFGWLASISGG